MVITQNEPLKVVYQALGLESTSYGIFCTVLYQILVQNWATYDFKNILKAPFKNNLLQVSHNYKISTFLIFIKAAFHFSRVKKYSCFKESTSEIMQFTLLKYMGPTKLMQLLNQPLLTYLTGTKLQDDGFIAAPF